MLAALVGALGCGDAARAERDVSLALDAMADAAVEVSAPDTAGDVAADAIPGDTGPAWSPVPGEGVALTLVDGRKVSGELIVKYDHRGFWFQPADTETWAVFDPAGLAPYPNDTSLAFVDLREAVEVAPAPLPVGVIRYRDALRDAGIVLQRSPLDVPAVIIKAGESYHLEEDGYGHFAWDFGFTDAYGSTWALPGGDNADHYIWDAPLASPVAGVVVDVVRDAPDGDVNFGQVPLGAINNLVGVNVFGNYSVYLLHQRQASIPEALSVGAAVGVGDSLGRVGNSGVSQAPHLHMTLLWFDAYTARSWSVPIEFADLWVAPTDSGATRWDYSAPWTGEWVANVPF